MNPAMAQGGLALLSQPSAGASGGVGGGGYSLDMTSNATARSSLNASGSSYSAGAGDITLGGISSKNISLLIIAAAIIGGLFLIKKMR